MTCVINDDDKYYPQTILEEELYLKSVCKKEIELFLIDKKQYKVSGIISNKINTLVNYQLVDDAVA